MANLGENLWGRIEEGKTASIRAGRIQYKATCQSKKGCQLAAVIQMECRDTIGHPFWNRDFCHAHAQPVLKRAELRGIPGQTTFTFLLWEVRASGLPVV